MAELTFDFEWIDPAGARGPALRATWARLELSIDGRPITRLVDDVNRGVGDGLFLPLCPVAEWLATHWWFLLDEVETPRKSSAGAYARRHSLRSAGEGFALPSVRFVPAGDFVRVEWSPIYLPAQRVQFTGEGLAEVPVEEFRPARLDT